MDAQVKVLQKGKVTIPVEMREALGVEEGDYLTVRLQEGSVVMSPTGTFLHPTEALSGLASGIPVMEPVDEELRKAAAVRARRKMERTAR